MSSLDFSIDDLLAEIQSEKKTKQDSSTKMWSMDEIDALLSGESAPAIQEDETVAEKNEKEADFEEEPELEFEPEPEFEEEPEPELEDELESELEEELEPEPEEEPEPELDEEEQPAPKKPLSQKTKVFSAESVKIKEYPLSEPIEKAKEEPEEENESSSIIMELASEKPVEEDPLKDEEILQEKKALAGKTVGIYPIRNENIDHKIVTEKVETSGAIVNDKYRERFMNAPKQHLERTADYEKLHPENEQLQIERPGMIIKKSKFTNTADLEPIPTIISADAELNNFDKTIVAKGEAKTIEHEESEDCISGQMRLGGFGEEEPIDQIDEDHAEEALKEKRDQKIASFKLDPDFTENDQEFFDDEEIEQEEKKHKKPKLPSLDSLSLNIIDEEYDSPEDYNKIRNVLLKAKRKVFIGGVGQLILTIVALILTGIISKSGGNVSLIGGSAIACGAVNIVLLVIALVFGFEDIKKGFAGIKTMRPNASTGVLLVAFACLLEDIIVMALAGEGYSPVPLYTAAAIFALFVSSVSRWIIIDRTKGNYDFITNGTQLYSSEKISDEDDAFEIGRGLLIGEPEVCYNAKIKFPKNFISNSISYDPADDLAKIIVPVVMGAAAIAAIVFGVVKRDVMVGFGMFAAVCSIAMPVFMIAASNAILLIKNRELNSIGAAITGYKAISESMNINAIVLDSTDIFRAGTCSIIGIKTFHNMRIDDAILYAAALIIESGGPLGNVFGNVILGKKELLPPVESMAYEERLGLSAWIHARRVLVGSRDLLINHNVQVPDSTFENQYVHDGRKVIYLAIAGKIAAMFVIKYNPDKHMRRYLQNVDKAGISLLVRSCDCNITEELICRYFNLPLSAVKVLSPVSGDIFQKYRTEEKETADSSLLHNGTIESSLKTLYEAGKLHDNILVNKVINIIYTVMAIIVFIVMTVMAGPLGITGNQIVFFQLLWTVIAMAVPIVKRKIETK